MKIIKKIIINIQLQLSRYGWVWNNIIFYVIGFFQVKNIMGMGKETKKLRKFKDKHRGERCFIIATGPSLLKEDILKLKNEYTISLNAVFGIGRQIDWRPTYYVLLDPGLCRRFKKNGSLGNIDELATDAIFFNRENKRELISTKKVNYINISYLDHVYNFENSTTFKESFDLGFGLYDCFSTTHDCIQIAMYMGFSEIYLLGADNNYQGAKKHCVDIPGDEVEDARALSVQRGNDIAYEFIKRIAEKRKVKIYNCTRGGRVNTFERVALDDLDLSDC